MNSFARSVNPNAQPEVNKTLEYFYDIAGNQVVLGQHTQTMEQEELLRIEEVTGELPALCGFELLAYSPNIIRETATDACLKEVDEDARTLEKAWEWAEKKGLITFTWHWYSPIGGTDKSFYTKNTDFDASKAIIPGTEEYYAVISDMDYMAGLLKPFCDAHIPILWRPFHECDGDWFWWGAKGPEVAKKLYRMMFDRYVNHFHLDNLIWVFNSNPIAELYPGDDVVDIYTCDMYPPAHEHKTQKGALDRLKAIAPEKLCAIGEIGTLPDIYGIVDEKLPWIYYMTWSKGFVTSEYCTTYEYLKGVYNCEGAVTLSRLPKLY